MTQSRASFGQKVAPPQPGPKSRPPARAQRSADSTKKLFYGVLAGAVGVMLLGAGLASFSGGGNAAAVAAVQPEANATPVQAAAVKPPQETAKPAPKRSASASAGTARSRTLGCLRRVPTTAAEDKACSAALVDWVNLSGAKSAARDIVDQFPEFRDPAIRQQVESLVEQALEQVKRGGLQGQGLSGIQPYIRR